MSAKILATGDLATTRQVVGPALRAAGYEVLEAVDGRDALARLAGTEVELIVADLEMPHLDGLGLIRAVRSRGEQRFVPILLLTGDAKQAGSQEATAAGATGWIVKPFTPEQLVGVVQRVLGRTI